MSMLVRHSSRQRETRNGLSTVGLTSYTNRSRNRNRYCGKEKDSESGLYYYGARYYESWTCRFVSVDPLAEKAMHIQAYAYCNNNPINYIDPTGAEVEITGAKPEKGKEQEVVKYKPGMKYEGKDEFIRKTIDNLNQLHAGSQTARSVIDDLVNSDKLIRINESTNTEFISDEGPKKYTLISFIRNPYINKDSVSSLASRISNGLDIGLGGKIELSYTNPASIPTTNGLLTNVKFSLAHELIHAWHSIKGATFQGKSTTQYQTNNPNFIQNTNINELLTSKYENYVRAEFNAPLRTHYALQDLGSHSNPRYVGYGPSLLQSPFITDTSKTVSHSAFPKIPKK